MNVRKIESRLLNDLISPTPRFLKSDRGWISVSNFFKIDNTRSDMISSKVNYYKIRSHSPTSDSMIIFFSILWQAVPLEL